MESIHAKAGRVGERKEERFEGFWLGIAQGICIININSSAFQERRH